MKFKVWEGTYANPLVAPGEIDLFYLDEGPVELGPEDWEVAAEEYAEQRGLDPGVLGGHVLLVEGPDGYRRLVRAQAQVRTVWESEVLGE